MTYISPQQRWGSAQRSRFLMEALCRHGQVDVLVINFHRGSPPSPTTTSLLEGARVMELNVPMKGLLGRPRLDLPSTHVTECVSQHVDLASYDLIVSRYIKPALKLRLPPQVPVIVDFDDAVYEPPWRALTSLKMKAGALVRLFNDRVLVRSLLRFKGHTHRHYFFCRGLERHAFDWLPGSVLPNLPAAPKRAGPPDFTPPQRPALLFIGLLDYMPNQDAVAWFLDKIWPSVRAAVPQARFLVVGMGHPDMLAAWAKHPGVEVLGFVDSLASAYLQATASVVPMRGGAGTNIKALEAYQYGRAVIATKHVLQGYDAVFRDNVDMLSARDAREFAAHCIKVLTQPELAASLAQSGHARLSTLLTQEKFRSVVSQAVDAVLKPTPTTT